MIHRHHRRDRDGGSGGRTGSLRRGRLANGDSLEVLAALRLLGWTLARTRSGETHIGLVSRVPPSSTNEPPEHFQKCDIAQEFPHGHLAGFPGDLKRGACALFRVTAKVLVSDPTAVRKRTIRYELGDARPALRAIPKEKSRHDPPIANEGSPVNTGDRPSCLLYKTVQHPGGSASAASQESTAQLEPNAPFRD
jgi:hypothetical protein